MVDEKKEVCGNCKYWKDYTDRVWAHISKTVGNRGRGQIELRYCKYNPPPTVEAETCVYTDNEYTCSGFSR